MGYYVNAGSVYGMAIASIVACTFAVLLRFLARRHKKVAYGPDDYCALPALVFTVACGIIMIIGASTHTIGWHSPPLPPEEWLTIITPQATLISKLQYVFMPLSALATGFVRLTFSFLYRRTFNSSVYKVFSIVNWILIGLIVLWTVGFFFYTWFDCGTHFSSEWETQEMYLQDCSSSFVGLTAMSLSDIILDLVLFVMPIYPLWRSHMPTRRKLFVSIVFALGIFSIAAGLAKIILYAEYYQSSFGSSKIFGLAPTDSAGIISTALWWAYLQLSVGCLVSNLPAMVGLLRDKMYNPLKALFSSYTISAMRSSHKSSRRESAVRENDHELLNMQPNHDDRPQTQESLRSVTLA